MRRCHKEALAELAQQLHFLLIDIGFFIYTGLTQDCSGNWLTKPADEANSQVRLGNKMP